ncbi:juvenile hormone esterase-like isoform X2 [Eurosta solidaginis]|uniref:juvenile hormone esterase-like isoform X2 n=1 Tax=Eurosta solidaginis TaxID=178769 RepID=UPI0035316745
MLLKFFILLNLFFCFGLKLGQTCSNSSSSKTDETLKIEFYSEEIKITVEGLRNKTWTGEEYFAFRGIPFAQPPVGELRFKDPKPLRELPTYIDARNDGYECCSIKTKNASEDCLTLNIYTPTTIETASLPVIVFIHAGGLYLGSAVSTKLGPAYLLSKQIVLVTFNYRLGTFGFLQLGTSEIPGNAGFKDQVQALRWVRKYIVHFGGNPQDITLMGSSAGALSISLHLVSPMSQGLFKKAILISGSVPPQMTVPQYAQLDVLRKQAHVLNCSEAVNELEILSCLQRFDGATIAATLRSLFEFGLDNPIYLFRPVIERDFGQERFLIEHPYESMQRGAFAKVPILIGFTNGEFCQSAVDIYKDSKLEAQFIEEFEKLAPVLFLYDAHKGNLSEINKALKDYYLPNFVGLNSANVARLCDLFSDGIIRFGAQRLAELAAQHTKIFPYSFEFRGEFSFLDYNLKPDTIQLNSQALMHP